jgi:hypothetical protein
MMGCKPRHLAPVTAISLEDLVPPNHFYRALDRLVDLSFVRVLVQDTYAAAGRPSIDPVVFFKLQLVMFLEGLRSERLLMRLVADKLSVRWYVGYNLDEPLPDHSSLTRIRQRYGVEMPPSWSRMGQRVLYRCHPGTSQCGCRFARPALCRRGQSDSSPAFGHALSFRRGAARGSRTSPRAHPIICGLSR